MRKTTLVVAGSLILAGCVVATLTVRSVNRPAGPLPLFADRARQVVDAWRQAVQDAGHPPGLRLLDAPLIRPAVDFPDQRTEHAFASGAFTLAPDAALPDQIPSPDKPSDSSSIDWPRTVGYPEGATQTLPLISARDAYTAIRRNRHPTCVIDSGDCLAVTGALLGIASVRTTEGPATVPAWLFTITDAAYPATDTSHRNDCWSDRGSPGNCHWISSTGRVAVSPAALVPLPAPHPPDLPSHLPLTAPVSVITVPAPTVIRSGDQADGAAAATRLSITFAVPTCAGVNPRPLVYEAADAVVIAVAPATRHHQQPCPQTPQMTRSTTTTLVTPLRYRVLLDAATGQPIPLGDR